VSDFYKQKQNSTGSARFIAKLHLNTLYGYFGRKLDLLETINVRNEDLYLHVSCRTIKNIYRINEEYSTIITSNNIKNHLKDLNTLIVNEIESNDRKVKANVAIASAVTAYARIHMIDYKLLPGTVYTDTDSIFTTDILDSTLIGKELGLMKDELNGLTIKEAFFLGINKYGYWYNTLQL
jgi:DNA polymerase type B, organellar and viral